MYYLFQMKRQVVNLNKVITGCQPVQTEKSHTQLAHATDGAPTFKQKPNQCGAIYFVCENATHRTWTTQRD